MEGSLIISVGSKFHALMTVIEWDMYLYVVVFVYFIGIIVSGTGAWDYEMLWQRNVEEVMMMMLY